MSELKSKVVPMMPGDDLFPTSFGGLNDFCRVIKGPGNVMVSDPPKPSTDPEYAGKEFVFTGLMAKEELFQVIRLDNDTFVIRRKK